AMDECDIIVIEVQKSICAIFRVNRHWTIIHINFVVRTRKQYATASDYHAWISVWTEKTGWVDATIYFDGKAWHRMDPTFASSAKQSEEIMKYIGDGSNYTEKYIY
ncbi:MAG: hypothetical protein IKL72_07060, partial [Firmicutes bacterium]|nr:hypothetical protein [Bacillota bacterium]